MASGAGVRPPVRRALRVIADHPHTLAIDAIEVDPESGDAHVEFQVRVRLPQRWAAAGRSPRGVRSNEPVTIVFGPQYPLRAPKVQLRADFNRTLAHINPGSEDAPPEPCLFEGSIDDLFHHQGIAGLLNQLSEWLDKAACGRLIDPKQGWEPIRRDILGNVVLADAEDLRSRLTDEAGYTFLPSTYTGTTSEGNKYYHISLHKTDNQSLDALVRDCLSAQQQQRDPEDPEVHSGTSLALLVWPPSSTVDNEFRPDTVATLADLEGLAAKFGSKHVLRKAEGRLRKAVRSIDARLHDGELPLAIILCARRPFELVNTDSCVEIIPYVAVLYPKGNLFSNKSAGTAPAAHRHHITPQLLQRMSGLQDVETSRPWTLLGAGSMGSKMGIHLARAGAGPRRVVDRSHMNPHNAARHALVPIGGSHHPYWNSRKSSLVAHAIHAFGRPLTAIHGDFLSPDGRELLLGEAKDDWAWVNATGSLAVREALSGLPVESLASRIIEASLFGAGQFGMLSIEGRQRNPNTGDLITVAYDLIRQAPQLAEAIFLDQGLIRQVVGEGCGSTSMPMSDARVSMFSSTMSEVLLRWYQRDLPDGGCLFLGSLENDGMGLHWRQHSLGASHVAFDARSSIHVRVLGPAHEKIEAEVKRYPNVETGGVLLGRFSEAAQTFYVVDVLPAPPDSRRSPAEFVLGRQGLTQILSSYVKETAGVLHTLGTWHSHLHSSGPSERDRKTAAVLHQGRPAPSVMLIHTPGGYRALLAVDDR